MFFPRGLVYSCLLSTLLVGAAVAEPAATPLPEMSAPHAAKRSFMIDAADAVQALERFAEQAHTPVIYLIEEVRGFRTNAVAGEFTPREALERMLANTALTVGEDARSGALVISRAERRDDPPSKPTEPTPKPMKKTNLLSAVVGWLALTAVPSQYAQATNPDANKQEQPVELSPFVVSSERDTGYAATDTLAGSRLRTPLKDIAASVSVVTKDLLEDLGATNAAELLVYTAGTEVVGVGGNYSGSTSGTNSQEFDAQRESSAPQTRLRGLAGADETRNFFLTPGIPLDSYNTESVTINRGANAVLFGTGSPAGIIENTLIAPRFRNKGQVQAQADQYGSHRETIDLERVLFKDKLSLRIAGLNDKQKFEQKPAHRDQERLFAAVTYRPFHGTRIRANAEKGHLDQSLPRVDPPLDSLTTWWDYGKPTRTNMDSGRMPDGTLWSDYATKNNLHGQAGDWAENPGLIFSSVDATTPSDAYVAWATAPGGVTYRHLGPRSSKEIAAVMTMDPLSGFIVGRQLLDRSIFDYRKHMIDGPNSGTTNDFHTENVALEQTFLNNDAGFELVHDRQRSIETVSKEFASYRGNNIFLDADTVTMDGRPNPNFGRPYIASRGGYATHDDDFRTERATAFIKHDFSQHWGFFGRLLGRQTLTGLFSDSVQKDYSINGPFATVEPTWLDGRNSNGLVAARALATVVYVGPSMYNMASPKGANLQAVQNKTVWPSSFPIWVENQGTGYKWVQQSPQIHAFPDYRYLASNVTSSRTEVKSYVGVLQSNWWDNILASTLGWRKDKVWTANGVADADPSMGAGVKFLGRPALQAPVVEESKSFSYGLAAHVPPRWLNALPGRLQLSLYYNESENFQASGARRSIIGSYLPPQTGKTKDWGFGLSGLDNRVSLRVTWYKTDQDNITDTRITGFLRNVAEAERKILNIMPKTQLTQLGYSGVDSPNISPLFKSYLEHYEFQMTTLRPDGTYDITYNAAPAMTQEVTQSMSKGMEIEGVVNPTRNWRVAFNASRQQATRGDTSAMFSALVAERLAQWQKYPQIWNLDVGLQTLSEWVSNTITNPLNTAKLSAGERTPELREWRFNMTTRYAFDRNSRFKGWAIGGSARWQDRVVIGYPVINDPQLGLVTDTKHPFMGPTAMTFDGLLSYERMIFSNRIRWKVQLNVYNLLNDNLMIPVKANPVTTGDLTTHENVAYRIGAERMFRLSSTFSF